MTDYFYYPYCKEKGCNGILIIKINNDFSIDYICDKNENHKGKKLYFKTFERFFLKEKLIDKCSTCNIRLENHDLYKCKQCGKIYCSSCFLNDKDIKNNINNLVIKNKKCPSHKIKITHYCIECKNYKCIYCIKDNNGKNSCNNNDHSIKCLLDYMPSIEKIKIIQQNLNEKLKYNEEIIDIISNWQIILNKKAEKLKRNLKEEIDFCKKMVCNYNQFFINYTYYLNIYYLDNYIKDFNNSILDKLKNAKEFEERTKIIIGLFDFEKKNNNNNFQKKNRSIKRNYTINDGFLIKLNDKYFFDNSALSKTAHLTFFEKENNSMKYLNSSNISFNEKIYSISFSEVKRKIYICLSNLKKVKILDYNIDEKIIQYNGESISDDIESNVHFNKCISITNELVVTADNIMIIIWYNKNKGKEYSIVKRILLNTKTSDILSVNNQYFISTQPSKKTIKFYNIEYLEEEKEITGVDFPDTQNILFLIKNYIIVNCQKGIAMILIKTKDVVQFIENFGNIPNNKEICFDKNDNIYILYKTSLYFIKILKLKIVEGTYEPLEEYNEMEINEKSLKFFCINEDDIILWGKGVYSLKE